MTTKLVLFLLLLFGAILLARHCGHFPGRLPYDCLKCTAIIGSSYWAPLATAAGLEPTQLKFCDSTNGSVWVYDNQHTCIGAGAYGDTCAVESLNCSTHGTTLGKNGYGADQMARVKEAVNDGGMHNNCPRMAP